MSNWLLFLVPSLIWGTTWLVIKFQLGVVAPETSVAYRFGLASVLLFGWCRLRRIPLRFDVRAHASFALIGALQYGISYVLIYLSEEHLTSGLLAVLFVLVVVWNLVGERVLFRSQLPASVIAGSVVGMAGVVLVFWPEVSHLRSLPGEMWAVALAVASSATASAGSLLSQRLYARGIAVAPSTAWAMLYATAGVAVYCTLRGIPFTFDASLRYLASLGYLALFGSVFAFIGYLTLLKRIGAGRAGYMAAVIPVIAMATSTVFEGYRWSGLAVSGLSLVVLGNVLVMRGKKLRPSTR